MHRHAVVVVVLVAALVLGRPVSARQGGTPQPVADLSDSPLGERIGWVVAALNAPPGALHPADAADQFAPAFLEAFPPDQIVGMMAQGGEAFGPFALAGFTRPPTATQANVLLIGSGGLPFVLPITIEATPPHRITGLNLAPVPPPSGVEVRPITADDADATGRLVTVDDRRFYLSCSGSGGPTVVLESGLGDAAAPWFAIERAVAPFTRVCTYDRANTVGGASDPAPTPRTVGDAAADLHALLAAAGEPGPFVLVGHSIGGLIVRLYASTYPDEVAGLVLVDASHEEQEARFEAMVSPELWAAYQEMSAQFPNPEGIDVEASLAEVRAARAAAPLRPVPLVVVTAGLTEDPEVLRAYLPPGWPIEEDARVWQELQADLARLVPNARHVIATQSTHYVHQSEPDIVVEAVRQVVEAARDPATLATPAAAPHP